jgi:hypothetical protein
MSSWFLLAPDLYDTLALTAHDKGNHMMTRGLWFVVCGLISGCNCSPPMVINPIEVPEGTNSVVCECVLAARTCGRDCCDVNTGAGTDAECTNTNCAPNDCCRPGTAGATCDRSGCGAFTQGADFCCDIDDAGTGACRHSQCELVQKAYCQSQQIAVCVPPNTARLDRFCKQLCERQNGKSVAVATGLVDPVLCDAVFAAGYAVPKSNEADAAIAWNDSACAGTCSGAGAKCNTNANCGAGETCSLQTCPPIACAFAPGDFSNNNFCFGATPVLPDGGSACCNTITPACGEPSPQVCRPMGDPPGALAHFFSQVSSGEISKDQSRITVTLADGTVVSPRVGGRLEFFGRPCPGTSCNVGVTFVALPEDFTAKGVTYRDLSLAGGMIAPELALSPSGSQNMGTVSASKLTITAQGTGAMNVTKALQVTPMPAVGSFKFMVDFVGHTFSMLSTTPFVFPGDAVTPGFTVQWQLSGKIKNEPPRAPVKNSLSIACDSAMSGRVVATAAGASDPDNNVLQYSWLRGPPMVGTQVGFGFFLDAGVAFQQPGPTTTQLTLQVTDTAGQVDFSTFDVTVSDTAPPTIDSVVNSTPCLWPPNHKYAVFKVGQELKLGTHDSCGGTVQTIVESVRSNQPAIGGGQGNQSPDFVFGTDAVCLRAERQGTKKEARVYTIVLAAVDEAGNKSTREVEVIVPHDQSADNRCRVSAPITLVEDDDPRCHASTSYPSMMLDVTDGGEPAPKPKKKDGGCNSIGASTILAIAAMLLRRRQS